MEDSHHHPTHLVDTRDPGGKVRQWSGAAGSRQEAPNKEKQVVALSGKWRRTPNKKNRNLQPSLSPYCARICSSLTSLYLFDASHLLSIFDPSHSAVNLFRRVIVVPPRRVVIIFI